MTDTEFKMRTVKDLATIKTNLEHVLIAQKDLVNIKSRLDRIEPKIKNNRLLCLISLTTFLGIVLNILMKGN